GLDRRLDPLGLVHGTSRIDLRTQPVMGHPAHLPRSAGLASEFRAPSQNVGTPTEARRGAGSSQRRRKFTDSHIVAEGRKEASPPPPRPPWGAGALSRQPRLSLVTPRDASPPVERMLLDDSSSHGCPSAPGA